VEADDLRAVPPSRGRMIRGERVARAAQWPAVDEVDADLVAALDPELRAAVEAAPLPVLLPSELPLDAA
jgi:hypothetical protein